MRPRFVACDVCEQHAEVVFRVDAMDCHEEVKLLEGRLKPLAGLEAVSADVLGRRLHVKYDAARLTPDEMVEAVGPTGLEMRLAHEPRIARAPRATGRLVALAGAGLGLGIGFFTALTGRPGLSALSYTAAALLGGIYPFRRAISALRARTLDIHVLMVVAVAGALAIGEPFEAATVVFLFAVAQWLEAHTIERARQAIGSLMDQVPQQATRRLDGIEARVGVDELRLGDTVVVRPGERVPVDGRVLVGESDVNEASLTGEAWPVTKSPGASVYAGTMNGRGTLDVDVQRVGDDTELARIVHLVEEAQASRAPLQSFVDRFASVYTPAVVALAVLVALVPPLVTGGASVEWVYRGLVLLVVACPCALVISTPVSFVAALAAAARHGVLIKGGAHLERFARARVVAFDKTGTLTQGRLSVSEVEPVPNTDAAWLLRLAAAAEVPSEHPVGRAIVSHARHAGVALPVPTAFTSWPGLGIEAVVEGRRVLVGGERLLREHEVAVSANGRVDELRAAGQTVALVAIDGMTAGFLAVADRDRGSAVEAVAALRAGGIERVVMLTGDHQATARATAAALALDDYHAGLLPEQKHAVVRELQAASGGVVMVGDGVNDAPALAAADVGVAMGGTGTDIALEAADVALVSDDLRKLPYAIGLAKATLRVTKANVAISLVLKLAFVGLAAAGVATLWMAIVADTGASVLVVANALRLRAR